MRILKLPEVMEMTALSRSSIYAYVGKNSFPKPIVLGARAVGWVEAEILAYLECCAAKRVATSREVTNG